MRQLRGLSWGLPEVIGTVQEVHCSRVILLRKGLEFHACTINKSAHTKKVWKLIEWSSYICEKGQIIEANHCFCIFESIIIAVIVSLGIPCAPSFFCLWNQMPWRNLITSNSVAARFLYLLLRWFNGLSEFWEVVDQVFRKPFWFFLKKRFSTSGSIRLISLGWVWFYCKLSNDESI